MSYQDKIRTILKKLESGHITSQEAEQLIIELNRQRDQTQQKDQPDYLKDIRC